MKRLLGTFVLLVSLTSMNAEAADRGYSERSLGRFSINAAGQGNNPWVNTVNLQAGKKYSIRFVGGSVRLSPGNSPEHAPSGRTTAGHWDFTDQALEPTLPLGCLLMKVGRGTRLWSEGLEEVTADAPLALAVNDSAGTFGDNSGSFSIEIFELVLIP